MSAAWQDELEGGWDSARAAFTAQGGVVAVTLIAQFLGLDLDEPLDVRIADHIYRRLLLSRCRVRLGRRSPSFSWASEGEAGTLCWLYPVYDADANLLEVLAFDPEGGGEHDVYSFGESLAEIGLDTHGLEPSRVLFAKPRGWLKFWVKQMRGLAEAAPARAGRLQVTGQEYVAARLHNSTPQRHAALIVRPAAIDWSPVHRMTADWAHGLTEVVVADADLGAMISRAFQAAASNPLPQLKLVSRSAGG